MPSLKNISKRTFTIVGKVLEPNQTETFAQSVIDRHLWMYKGELEQVSPLLIPEDDVLVLKERVDVTFDVDEEPENEKPEKYPSQMNKTELQAYLTEKGIEFPEDATKKQLFELTK